MDAARGMGLDARQRLFEIELPLALPAILAGLRLTLVINARPKARSSLDIRPRSQEA